MKARYLSLLLLATTLPNLSCANMFANRTITSYTVTAPDGTKTEVKWDSNQDHIGLDAAFSKDGNVKVKVDSVKTNDKVVDAVLQLNMRLQSQLDEYAKKLATMGAAS